MNKAELVDRVAKLTGQTKSSVEHTLNTTLAVIKKSIQKGEAVTLMGFGTFVRFKRKARMGRHPQTGEELEIPAATVPRFRPGKEFKGIL